MKMDLLTNATVVDDAIRFVAEKSNEKEKVKSAIKGDKEKAEQNEYDEEKDQLEEEEEAGEMITNQVF
jgi:hypothetical protein